MDENYRIIYRILRTLEREMDAEEIDPEMISAECLGVNKARWANLIEMLVDSGYIKGVTAVHDLSNVTHIVLNRPMITLKGLEYLTENTLMQRVMKMAKGIKESIPGV